MKKTILLALISLLLLNCGSPKKRELNRKAKQVSLATKPINDSLLSVEVITKRGGIFGKTEKTALGFSTVTSSKKLIRYDLDSTQINILSVHEINPWHITFKKSGVNKLFTIHSFGFGNTEDKNSIRTNTDFVGPYIMKNANDSLASLPKFTGGWHGSNGDVTGEPTGRTIEWNVYDHKANIVTSDSLYRFSRNLWIEVINLIQSYNSKEEILKETVQYEIHPYGLNVHIEIEALNDLEIETYYGIQSQNPYFFDELTYHFEDSTQKKDASRTYNQSNDSVDNNRVTHYTLQHKNLPFQMAVWLDGSSHLANGTHLEASKPWAFTAGYGKSYFNLINGKKLNLKQGDKKEIRGGYYFLEKNN